MILVDTSVWIEFLAGRRRLAVTDRDLANYVTCGPVIQEVFQGLRPGPQAERFRNVFTALPVLCDPLPLSLFRSAAEIYQRGRHQGITIRSSVDCLIAAIAIESGVTVLHRDRDFDAIATYTALGIAK